jgi:hypothetical protein
MNFSLLRMKRQQQMKDLPFPHYFKAREPKASYGPGGLLSLSVTPPWPCFSSIVSIIRTGSFLKIKEEATPSSIEAASEGYRASRMARSHGAKTIFLTPSQVMTIFTTKFLTFSFPR